jgi:hypothetical protein
MRSFFLDVAEALELNKAKQRSSSRRPRQAGKGVNAMQILATTREIPLTAFGKQS